MSNFSSVDGRRPFGVALAALIGCAWVSLWLWGQSPYGRFLSHEGIDAGGGGGLVALTFVGGWTLRICGMSLPSRLAVVPIVGGFPGYRANRPWGIGGGTDLPVEAGAIGRQVPAAANG